MAFTFFFRDMHVLETVVKHVTPTLAGRTAPRIWDAGCAMGPEPYSLAIMFAETMGRFGFNNLNIDATDLEEQFGPIVRAGIYPHGDIERIPVDILERYFEAVGDGQYQVVERVRSRLVFRQHDLLSLVPIGTGFSLIVCKNVLLHFQQAERVKVIQLFHDALLPGGFLVTEQTQKLPDELAPLFDRVVSDAQLFRKAGGAP